MKLPLKIIIQILIGAIGYVVWGVMAYYDAAQRADFLHFNIFIATGVIGLVVRDMKSPADAGTAAPQSTDQQVTK